MRTARTRMARFARFLVLGMLALVVGFAGGRLVARIAQRALTEAEPTPLETPSSPASATSASHSYSAWDQEADSNYYRVLGPAVVGTAPEAGTVRYGKLDQLGRATGATALITHELMVQGTERSRGDVSDLRPSGWGHNEEVDIAMPDGTVYHGFLFNRSHLVAKSLGGDDELHNLITGTRTQNVGANVRGQDGGMSYAEGLARMWLYRHQDGTVYYAATPVYEGDEPVARSIIVDVRSDDGTLDQRIEVFNAARGFAIDYATGTFAVTENAEDAARSIRESLQVSMRSVSEAGDAATAMDETSTEATDVTAAEAPADATDEDGDRKVIVTRSGKAYHHDETCSGLSEARSMRWVTVSEAEEMGRHPCGICGG